MKKLIVMLGTLLGLVWAGEWEHDFTNGVSVRQTDGAQFRIVKKQLNNHIFPSDLEFGKWHVCHLDWLIDLKGGNGELFTNIRFSTNAELKVVRRRTHQWRGTHYFVKDYERDSQNVKLYKLYDCDCYVAFTEVQQRFGDIESVVWSSDFEPMHAIIKPTGARIPNPWEASIHPLHDGVTLTNAEEIKRLLLASL